MDKTKAVIAYIVNYFQCNDSLKNLGKVKLVKILWFADREFMHAYYKQLTNLEYRKMPRGPMPINIDTLLESMQEEGIIKSFNITRIGGYTQQSFMCLKEPNLNDFTSQEINILDKVIMELRHKNATQLSNKTHDELWQDTNLGDIMPLESVFLQDILAPITESEKKYFATIREEAKEYEYLFDPKLLKQKLQCQKKDTPKHK